MAQPPSRRQDLSSGLDCRVVLFPTRYAAYTPAQLPASSAARRMDRPVRVRSHTIRQVTVLAASGRLSDVVEELDLATQLALADAPRGVVCDLSALTRSGQQQSFEPRDVEVLAAAGRHVRDWPGIPVAVACADPSVREALCAHPLGGHLIVTASLFSAITAVLATPTVKTHWLRLAPHPTAARASREFVTRTLLDWRLGRVTPSASLVVSELVASATVNSGSDVDVSVAWDRGALRLTVRDRGLGLGLPGPRSAVVDLPGRRLTVVAGLSRSFGVLPTTDGGTVVWAVLDAARAPQSTGLPTNPTSAPTSRASLPPARLRLARRRRAGARVAPGPGGR